MTQDILGTSQHPDLKTRQRRAEGVVNLGLFTNCILAIVKVFAGILGHSQALLADGINSMSDVVYYIVVKIFVGLSGKPADQEHPYGHHQFESIAALVVGAFVITTGIAILWDSINETYDMITKKEAVQQISTFALWVALATVLIKIFLMMNAAAIGKKTKNIAIRALARDHRNDIFSAAGAALGIVLGMYGLPWFDPAAGAIVAGVVIKTGFSILRDSSADLMDSVPSEQLAEEIRFLCGGIRQIEEIEEIHAHRFGPYLVVNITIGICGDLTVTKGDAIANEVEACLVKEIDMLRKVYVHYHPSRKSTKTL